MEEEKILSMIASAASSHAPGLNAASGAARASRSGIWVGLFAITMSFAAFSSALFVRQGTPDWGHLALPSILYLNTLVLLLSSGTLELSRRSLAHATPADSGVATGGIGWLLCTLALGIAFCCGQYMAWQNLRAQGIYLATNPNSSFFYVLTFMHVLHLVAGIVALLYLTAHLVFRRATFRSSLFDNTAIYWHFLGVLWVYLFLLCLMKL